MEDRYEIRGKIGQGGIGSVHRAYDNRMRREVAIKRILSDSDDIHLETEATKQLMAEVGALASLQHPHIVTVFDVGSDEKGPYIVMELINGKTLDEIIEQAPLVWNDFKVLAMQSLEALIAAQELDMIHSDLKPPNIMLTWLPSGAFQVKIVDFGLAVLVQNQSQEEIEKMEAIYGSIFFMPPEQYERKTLDTRSDLYSLGCCFYQALAGTYPFNGHTGMEVMKAHLNHTVTPIEEIRADLPEWACEWVMWLINRQPDDRPASAREALANFLQNDKESGPVVSRDRAPTSRTRLIIPAASTGPVTMTAATATSATPAASPTAAVPVPARRTTSSVPTRTTSSIPVAPLITTATASHSFGTDGKIQVSSLPPEPETRNSSKKSILVVLVILFLLALLGGGGWWWYTNKFAGAGPKEGYDKIAAQAELENIREIKLSSAELQMVIDYIVNNPGAYLTPAFSALAKAKAADGTDFDATIAQFATTGNVQPKIRARLFEEVIAKRAHPGVIPAVLQFSASAGNPDEAIAAFDSVSDKFSEQHAQGIIAVISTTDHTNLRQSAESAMKQIIASSPTKAALAELITQANQSTTKTKARPTLDRLLERCKTSSP